MLKWAVNNPNRPSQLNVEETLPRCHQSRRDRRALRRKSSGHDMANIRRRILNRDKENNLTSTPLPLHRQSLSPLRKYDSLRDLSNIPTTPDILSTPLQSPKNYRTSSTIAKNNPLQYASTLPTFDAEYSPCSLVPGPILALRGLGVADTYFEKPRYLSNDMTQFESKRVKTNPSSPTAFQLNQLNLEIEPNHIIQSKLRVQQIIEDESISSSRMGDITLDRMIDAILESARKERRIPKIKQQNQQCHPIMSPSYTPAEDPASDLNEIWHPVDERSRFNEREVRTPDSFSDDTIRNSSNISQDPTVSCHLRRQRAVRRKRKLASTTDQGGRQHRTRSPIDQLLRNNSFLRKSFDQLVEMDTPKGYEDLSPDSGRNSPSDLEDSSEDNNNCTRRRLSFSPNSQDESKLRDRDKVG